MSAVATAATTVQRVRLEVGPARLAALRGLLSPAERERAGRLRFARDADRFTAGRGLLRLALAERTGTSPEALVLAAGPHGKPFLPEHPGLWFNASGSDDAGLLAIGTEGELGIDLERVDASADGRDVARLFFAPEEIAELDALDGAERQLAFLQAWTRKEAYVKARGEGLQTDLDRFAVSLRASEPAALRWSREGDAERWQLTDLSEPGAGMIAALCHPAGAAPAALGEDLA